MKRFNTLMSMLLIGASIGSVSAVITEETHVEKKIDGTTAVALKLPNAIEPASAREVVAETVAETPLMTLKNLNKLQKDKDSGVRVLFALPKLPEGARPMIPLLKGSTGLIKYDFEINGEIYDLWTNWSSVDLERDGGSAAHTYDNKPFSGERTKETWHTNYYLAKEGAKPGESENALDVTGKIPGIVETVYVVLGDVFLNQENASYYDNRGREDKSDQLTRARNLALKSRKNIN